MSGPAPAGRPAGTPAGTRPGTRRTARPAEPAPDAASGASTEAAPGTAQPRGGRARRAWRALRSRNTPLWLTALVAVLAVVGLTGSAVLVARPDEASLRSSAAEAAVRYTALLTTYDAATLDEDVERVRRVSTAAFADEYAETIEALRAQITEGGTVSVGRVVGAGLEGTEGDTATVLVAVDQQLTSRGQQPRTEASRVRMVLERDDGSWRIRSVVRL